ncbi:hypothetical protein AB9F35_34735, partial [Rhizobium leguminosarum]
NQLISPLRMSADKIHFLVRQLAGFRQMLAHARIKASFASDEASAAVERIMSAAFDNAGALIAVAKLKEKDELTFLHSLAVSALMI